MLSWEEVPTNSKGTDRPPHRPPRRAPCLGCSRRWGSVQKALGVCPGRVRGRGAPEPSAQSLALGDLTRDLAGLREQSKGGSLSMRTATCPPQWPTGQLRPDPQKRLDHPATVAATQPHAGPGGPNHPCRPAGSGRCTGGVRALCIWRPLLGLNRRGMAASNIQSLPSNSLSREVLYPSPGRGPRRG